MRFVIVDFFSMNREKWYKIRQEGLFIFVIKYFLIPFGIGIPLLEILGFLLRKATTKDPTPILQRVIEIAKLDFILYPIILIPIGIITWYFTERHYRKPTRD